MKDKLKAIKIIHIAMSIGTIIAYFVLGDLTNLNALKFPEINADSTIYLSIPLIAFASSSLLFKKQIQNIDSNLSLEEKLPLYQIASIIRWAILEGASFMILILKKDFLIIGIFIIVYLIYLRPTENKIRTDLNDFI